MGRQAGLEQWSQKTVAESDDSEALGPLTKVRWAEPMTVVTLVELEESQ